ncbi:flagellar basal body rod protein FlgB [Malikia sp.]|uniref:flagellar basal body rod protein FlgB n=1 Tax=Malikia sp. TaxID=2070706 RepID=UPI0026144A30|nr:flagellar basal body rod protein FlgB [Malikia sp.]MDD2727858.1 flagellar basal body rod protein FlgB [Malikia sp.]
MAGRLDEALGFYENALRLRAQRQQVLASNIANADTPHFKARDFDFAQAMQAAMGASSPASPELARTHAGHLAAEPAALSAIELKPRQSQQNSFDGNTVEMDRERSAFTENALRYEAGATLVQSKIKGILSVIQG